MSRREEETEKERVWGNKQIGDFSSLGSYKLEEDEEDEEKKKRRRKKKKKVQTLLNSDYKIPLPSHDSEFLTFDQ
jgi:hypothetical protein